jgi:AcrR family transcriptional regulator
MAYSLILHRPYTFRDETGREHVLLRTTADGREARMALDRIPEPANARSRRTRAALLAAARSILETQGFEALTMSAVAEHTSVTRRAAYLHFGTRAALVGALFDYLAEAEGLADSLAGIWSAPDAVAALDEWARHLGYYHPRLIAVERVRYVDRDAAAHRDRVAAEKLATCHRLAAWLSQDGRLAEPWTVQTARDMLYGLISSDLIEALTGDRPWSSRRLARHRSVLFRATFTRHADQSEIPG